MKIIQLQIILNQLLDQLMALLNQAPEDFSTEVEALSQDPEFITFLQERKKDTSRVPLTQVKARLGLN